MVSPERIQHNLRQIQERIARAAARSGRAPESVRLVAVTKTVDVAEVRALWELGVRDFAENRVQELLRKIGALADLPARWHMIGSLQTNKASKVVGAVEMLHSIDSLRLAEAVNAAAQKKSVRVEALVEVNVSGEASKHGLAPDHVAQLLEQTARLEHLRITGLMTMAPYSEEPERARPVFRGLRELRDKLRGANARLEHLSMGMSNDFEIAIEEGADLVRIGTALFQEE